MVGINVLRFDDSLIRCHNVCTIPRENKSERSEFFFSNFLGHYVGAQGGKSQRFSRALSLLPKEKNKNKKIFIYIVYIYMWSDF